MTRQARLKPEFAHFYPGVEPDAWHPAAELADQVLACRLLLPSGGFVLHERAMSGGHFEFRGGARPRLAAPNRGPTPPRNSKCPPLIARSCSANPPLGSSSLHASTSSASAAAACHVSGSTPG